jgi:predicted RND superfamily exporter protein
MVSLMEHLNEPGSSMKLLPVIQGVTIVLMLMCLAGIYVNVVRIHLMVMLFLGAGLLVSVSFVGREFEKAKTKKEPSTDEASKPHRTKTTKSKRED